MADRKPPDWKFAPPDMEQRKAEADARVIPPKEVWDAFWNERRAAMSDEAAAGADEPEDDEPEGDEDIIELHTLPGLFDPLDRPLTPEEKADPMTFFGVPLEVRQERIARAQGVTDWAAKYQLTDAQRTEADQPTQRPDGPRMKP